jgi:oligopeptide transport system ATP-binding protein
VSAPDRTSRLLSVRDLRTWFDDDSRVVKAVDGVSFDVRRGETLGIVGESGSGKSVTSLSIMRLLPTAQGRIVSGEIMLEGRDLLTLRDDEMRAVRGKRIAMVFQDPMSALNPFMRISAQMMEVTRLHLGYSRRQAHEQAIEMLETVGLSDARLRADQYPHQFSGGMRQRVMIAMALSCDPQLLIADEPTTALDVTIQAQVMDVFERIQDRTQSAMLLITHDLGVVAGVADAVMVMYAGRDVEHGTVDELFYDPRHPYTRGLLSSLPRPDVGGRAQRLQRIRGNPPSLLHLPQGCSFWPRCVHAKKGTCDVNDPELFMLGGERSSRCFFAEQLPDWEPISG